MQILDPTEWLGPLPAAEGDYATFFNFCAKGELAIQSCLSCGFRQGYPRSACSRCAGEVEWITCSGLGTIHTFTTVRNYGIEPFKSELPYVVAIIDLDEGVRLMGTIIDCAPEEVEIGLRVMALAKPLNSDVAVPVWRLNNN